MEIGYQVWFKNKDYKDLSKNELWIRGRVQSKKVKRTQE